MQSAFAPGGGKMDLQNHSRERRESFLSAKGKGAETVWACGTVAAFLGAEMLAQLLGKGHLPKELLLCQYFNSCAKLQLGSLKSMIFNLEACKFR